MSHPLLTPVQARVLAAMVEKSITTPNYYPMTVNGIANACNQKSCRDPVMRLSEGEVGSALLDLGAQGLVAEDIDRGRVPKWRQRLRNQLLLDAGGVAVLATLMLRGPQTVAELRANAASLRGPGSVEEVQALLADLADKAEPLVLELPRQSGQKETRYAHLLCGEDAIPEPAASPPAGRDGGSAARLSALEERVAQLEAALARLQGDIPPQ